jgi:hypothetical protein
MHPWKKPAAKAKIGQVAERAGANLAKPPEPSLYPKNA